MTYMQAIILGIIQGVTEFFPVSSSGHLVLTQVFFGIQENVLIFDICVHFGSLLAVLTVFRRKIANLISACLRGLRSIIADRVPLNEVYKSSQEIRISLGIIIGTLPAVIAGFTMKDFFESLFHSAGSVFAALFFTGCMLLVTFFFSKQKHHIGSVNGFIIGLAQALAIIPGISRSGSTISTALFLGVKREEAGEFSFLLSIPVILGASILALMDYIEAGFTSLQWEIAIVGTFFAFLSGWISLVLLLRIVRHGKIGYFGFYCLAIALAGFILYVTGISPRSKSEVLKAENTLNVNLVSIKSTYDNKQQMVKYYQAQGESRPLLVALHSWSFDYSQDSSDYFYQCRKRNWHCIFPDFRGANNKPEACGSEAALADILDAVQWALSTFDVDHRRIFLVGTSGGGHMALHAAGHSPSTWTAVSVWVPISDLSRWHKESTERELKYASDIEKVCGGPPGASKKINAEYSKRSPVFSLWRAHIIPMDINAGIHDGHGGTFGKQGSVPVGHSIRAFNELAKAAGDYDKMIEDNVIDFIEQEERLPNNCDSGDTSDSEYSSKIHMRRKSSLSRLTLFEGGHEILYDAAFKWFELF